MGKFRLIISEIALQHIAKHKKVGNKATIKKIEIILKELENHPTTGSGKPEQLKFAFTGLWSRRINHKDRLIYEIIDDTVCVEVISALGHYHDN